MKRFAEHQCIEVHHQYGVRTYSCKSFATCAINDGVWDYQTYRNKAEAEEAFDEVPEELAQLLAHGPAVEVSAGDDVRFVAEEDFDAEEEARKYLAEDLHCLIVLDTLEEARDCARNYRGHEDIKVRAAAREIMEREKDFCKEDDVK